MNCYEAIDVMGNAVEGGLPATLRTGFEEHVAECRSCGTYFEHLQFARLALQSLPREEATPRDRDALVAMYREAQGMRTSLLVSRNSSASRR